MRAPTAGRSPRPAPTAASGCCRCCGARCPSAPSARTTFPCMCPGSPRTSCHRSARAVAGPWISRPSPRPACCAWISTRRGSAAAVTPASCSPSSCRADRWRWAHPPCACPKPPCRWPGWNCCAGAGWSSAWRSRRISGNGRRAGRSSGSWTRTCAPRVPRRRSTCPRAMARRCRWARPGRPVTCARTWCSAAACCDPAAAWTGRRRCTRWMRKGGRCGTRWVRRCARAARRSSWRSACRAPGPVHPGCRPTCGWTTAAWGPTTGCARCVRSTAACARTGRSCRCAGSTPCWTTWPGWKWTGAATWTPISCWPTASHGPAAAWTWTAWGWPRASWTTASRDRRRRVSACWSRPAPRAPKPTSGCGTSRLDPRHVRARWTCAGATCAWSWCRPARWRSSSSTYGRGCASRTRRCRTCAATTATCPVPVRACWAAAAWPAATCTWTARAAWSTATCACAGATCVWRSGLRGCRATWSWTAACAACRWANAATRSKR